MRFEVKVSLNREQEETGKVKKTSELYLVNTETFGEAEKIVYSELEQQSSVKTIAIQSIKLVTLKDIYGELIEEDEKFYRIKVAIELLDETSNGKPKVLNENYLVAATSLKKATNTLEEKISEVETNWKVIKSEQTSILEVLE